MPFFEFFTLQKLIGLILIAAGALITYKSEKIAMAIEKPQLELTVKFCGLGVVIIAFILIMTAK